MQDVGWTHIPISKIEDLRDAIRGAGLEAMQMSAAPLQGNLAFLARRDVTYNTGLIGGRVALKGPLSTNMVTLGLGVHLPSGTKHWLNEVTTGNIGVFLQGDSHESLYMPGSIYASATLSLERLEELAAKFDLILTKKELIGSGVVSQRLAEPTLKAIQNSFRKLHSPSQEDRKSISAAVGEKLLIELIHQLARAPSLSAGSANPQGYARVVAQAREFILDNLNQPLSIEVIAAAASTSHRTLHRSFIAVLGETPYSYVQKARLHRIRREFTSDAEKARTITFIAQRWGIQELGRFSGWYRDLFGELPSATLRRQRAAEKLSSWQDMHSRN